MELFAEIAPAPLIGGNFKFLFEFKFLSFEFIKLISVFYKFIYFNDCECKFNAGTVILTS